MTTYRSGMCESVFLAGSETGLLVADPTIKGHPVIELDTGADEPTLITVCGHCGEMRTIILLVKDRWYCSRCRAEGATPPNLYPVA